MFMIMPVRQNCPKCGREFMGSDCIGRPCMDCVLRKSTQMQQTPHIYEKSFFGDSCAICSLPKIGEPHIPNVKIVTSEKERS